MLRTAETVQRTLRTSARNSLRGTVTAIIHGPVSAEVGLLINDRIVVDAVLTNTSVDSLGLRPGGQAVALIKSTFVTLLRDTPGLRLSTRNLFGGRVREIIAGPVEAEVHVAIGGGVDIVAMIDRESLEDLALAVGEPVLAAVKASHIILAVED